MINHPNRHRLRRLAPTALFLASIPATAMASRALSGPGGIAARILLALAVIALGARALWWLGVDGRRPDMARIMSDRDARRARR